MNMEVKRFLRSNGEMGGGEPASIIASVSLSPLKSVGRSVGYMVVGGLFVCIEIRIRVYKLNTG